jgi:GNAT superfamily N-acetyltransferase
VEDKASYQVVLYSGGTLLPDRYRSLIFSKWLRSLRYGNDYFRLIDSSSYYSAYHQYLERILDNPLTQVRLAMLSDDNDVVLGFSVARGTCLDYVHVHRDYRRSGIGTALLPKGQIDFISHITRKGMSFWNNRLKEARFDPFK